MGVQASQPVVDHFSQTGVGNLGLQSTIRFLESVEVPGHGFQSRESPDLAVQILDRVQLRFEQGVVATTGGGDRGGLGPAGSEGFIPGPLPQAVGLGIDVRPIGGRGIDPFGRWDRLVGGGTGGRSRAVQTFQFVREVTAPGSRKPGSSGVLTEPVGAGSSSSMKPPAGMMERLFPAG
jgi:hypothetical protein